MISSRVWSAARARARALLTEDRALARAVLMWALAQLVIALWSMPSRFSWENDGAIPRDLFAGVGLNLTPGQGHRYPLFHYLLVAIAALPAWLWGLVTAEELSVRALERRLLQTDVMTMIELAAKLLAAAMGAVLVLTLARIVRRTIANEYAQNAGRFAAFFAATSLSVAYYARTTNLDGPALMWIVLACDVLLDLRENPRSRASFAALGALVAAAVATKDQAYAAFVLLLAIYLVRHVRVGLVPFTASCVATYGVLSGALFNPSGFIARLHMLTGPNSQDWRGYERSLSGVLENIRDIALRQADFFWGWPVIALGWLGMLTVLHGRAARDRGGALVVLVMALSSLLTFTLVVARADHRFVLPLGLALAAYAGVAAAQLWPLLQDAFGRTAGRVIAAALAACLAVPCTVRYLELAVTQWTDSRFEVERYLASLPPGSNVEVYGLMVYWPRFDFSERSPYRVTHVDRRALAMPGLAHAALPYGDPRARGADVLVLPEEFAQRYRSRTDGKQLKRAAFAELDQGDGRAFFSALLDDELPGYRRALLAEPSFPDPLRRLGLAPIEIHGSTGKRTAVYVRSDARASSALTAKTARASAPSQAYERPR